jgi:hydrogenase maturation protease
MNPVLIFAIGNESRADDAIAPLMLRELALWLKDEGIDGKIELLEEFQLQIEHAMDMHGKKIVLFIDAGMDTPAPFSFYRLHGKNEAVLFSHALLPEALLTVYAKLYAEPAPAAFVLCVRGNCFELGESLSIQARENMASALEFAKQRLLKTDVTAWDAACIEASLNLSGKRAAR